MEFTKTVCSSFLIVIEDYQFPDLHDQVWRTESPHRRLIFRWSPEVLPLDFGDFQ